MSALGGGEVLVGRGGGAPVVPCSISSNANRGAVRRVIKVCERKGGGKGVKGAGGGG